MQSTTCEDFKRKIRHFTSTNWTNILHLLVTNKQHNNKNKFATSFASRSFRPNSTDKSIHNFEK